MTCGSDADKRLSIGYNCVCKDGLSDDGEYCITCTNTACKTCKGNGDCLSCVDRYVFDEVN